MYIIGISGVLSEDIWDKLMSIENLVEKCNEPIVILQSRQE